MTYRLEQGIIQRYKDARTCDVMQLPDHYISSDVRLPETLQNQTKPLVGSTVMMATEDSFKSYIIAVLREPLSFVSKTDSLRGNTPLNSLQLQPGEIFFESRGPADSPQPGAGATLFLGNDGTASIYSGKRKEYLILGGTDDDDDGEVLLVGDNGFYESNVNHLTSIQSVYRFDEDNTLQMGNVFVVLPPPTPITPPLEIPQAELTIDTFSNIVLRNTTAGADKAYLKIDTTSQIKLANPIASITMSPLGDIAIQNAIAQFNAQSSGAITIDGTTINLNSGTFGVARLNDATIVNSLTDPTFMSYLTLLDTFMAAVFTAYNSHTHIYIDTPVGPSITAIPLPLITAVAPSHPSTVTGKINAASSTVKAGG